MPEPVHLTRSNYIQLLEFSKTIPKDIKANAISIFNETGQFTWTVETMLKEENLII